MAPAKGGKKAPAKKGANGYKLPDPINPGEIITDLAKKQWIIEKSIGVGGFGEIYSAAPYSGKTPKDYPAVIKIEPHGNGPLFVEMHFFMRNCKPDVIEAWRQKKKLPFLGMPKFNGSGSHEYKGTKYRFIVMDRYGTDLWKIFLENNRKFPEHTVYKIAIQIIDVLEYMHNNTYIHADIKASNLLLSLKNPNQVYLADYGLSSHYTRKTEYKSDPKKAHNGTIEYTSRDAHFGIPTMRSDFEILGYNLIQWLTGFLPWEKNLKDPSVVQKQKEKAFSNIKSFLKECFEDNPVPVPITQFMNLLSEMEFNDTPDYAKFREIFVNGLQKLGHKVDGPLVFSGDSAKKIETGTPKIKRATKTTEDTPKRATTKTGDDTPKRTTTKAAKDIPKRATTKAAEDILKMTKKTLTPVKRKSPRIKASSPPPLSPCPHPSLDDSCVGIVVDKKREKLKDMRKILELIEEDSDTEFDIVITKKKSKVSEVENKIPAIVPRKAPVRKGRAKVVKNYDDDDSEPEVMPRGTRTRTIAAAKASSRKKAVERNLSDEDMFDE